MARKLMFMSLGFAASLFSLQFLLGNPGAIAFLIIAAVVLSVVLVVKKHPFSALFLIIGILFGVIWQSAYAKFDTRIPADFQTGEYTAYATVEDYSRQTRDKDKVFSRVKMDSVSGIKNKKPIRAMVYFNDPNLELKPGDKVVITGKMFVPTNTEAFDSYTYTKSNKIDLNAFVTEVDVFPCQKVPVKYAHKTLSYKIENRIKSITNRESAAFLVALTLGDKTNISKAMREEFSVTGLSHTIAISGMHLSFVLGIIMLIFKKRYVKYIALPIMVLFVLITGAPPSIVRAFIMQIFVLFAPSLLRENDSVTALFAALFAILLFNPFAIGDVGLQLSFAATLGLVVLMPELYGYFLNKSKFMSVDVFKKLYLFVGGVFSTTISAMIFTAPILIYHFNTISLIAPIANIFVIWAISILFQLTIGVLGVSLISVPVAKLLANILNFIILYITKVVSALASIPYAAIYGKNILVMIAFVIMYLGIILYFIFKTNELTARKYIFLPTAVIVSVCLVMSVVLYNRNNFLEVNVADVGQGLCVVAQHSSNTIIIDCGGDSSQLAETSALNILKKLNTRTVNALIVTHIDDDHINGVESVLEKANVKTLYIPEYARDNMKILKIRETAYQRQTEIVYVENRQELEFGNLKVFILPSGLKTDIENDSSQAVLLSEGEFDVLVTGDLEEFGETVLISRNDLPDVEVYVAGHHGSKKSSTDDLLNVIKPETAIISASENNIYRLPDMLTLERFATRGIKVYRTDINGDIKFNSKNIFK